MPSKWDAHTLQRFTVDVHAIESAAIASIHQVPYHQDLLGKEPRHIGQQHKAVMQLMCESLHRIELQAGAMNKLGAHVEAQGLSLELHELENLIMQLAHDVPSSENCETTNMGASSHDGCQEYSKQPGLPPLLSLPDLESSFVCNVCPQNLADGRGVPLRVHARHRSCKALIGKVLLLDLEAAIYRCTNPLCEQPWHTPSGWRWTHKTGLLPVRGKWFVHVLTLDEMTLHLRKTVGSTPYQVICQALQHSYVCFLLSAVCVLLILLLV